MSGIKIDAKDTLGNYSVNHNKNIVRVGAKDLAEPSEGQMWTRDEIEEIADERIDAALSAVHMALASATINPNVQTAEVIE